MDEFVRFSGVALPRSKVDELEKERGYEQRIVDVKLVPLPSGGEALEYVWGSRPPYGWKESTQWPGLHVPPPKRKELAQSLDEARMVEAARDAVEAALLWIEDPWTRSDDPNLAKEVLELRMFGGVQRHNDLVAKWKTYVTGLNADEHEVFRGLCEWRQRKFSAPPSDALVRLYAGRNPSPEAIARRRAEVEEAKVAWIDQAIHQVNQHGARVLLARDAPLPGGEEIEP